VARAREVPGLDCEEEFRLAAARVVKVRAAEVFEHSAGVLDLTDVEPLHDMRVATRRLRAALEVFRPCFPRKRHRLALKQVKALAGALGERRDRDVSIAFLEGFMDQAPVADHGRLEILLAGLRDEQLRANRDLGPYLSEERLHSLRTELSELAGVARG
jgi:CHAD domain-containing protein